MTKRSLALIIAVACALIPDTGPVSGQASGTVTLFEGARLISGDAGDALEGSAFIVDNDRIVRVGRKGELALPPGAARST